MRPIALVLLLLACSACAPIVAPYEEVSATEGTVKGHCAKAELGPPSRLELDRGRVHISADGSNLSSGGGALELHYLVPLDSDAALDWNQFKVTDEVTGAAEGFKIAGTDVIYHRQNSFWDIAQGRPYKGDGRASEPIGGRFDPAAVPSIAADAAKDKPVDYGLTIRFDGPMPERFDFRLPDMTVDGVSYPGLDMHFQHTLGVYCFAVPMINVPHI